MTDFSEYSEGDDIFFEYELSSVAKTVSRHGEVSEVTDHALFVEVEMPTRLIEYELQLRDGSVVKHLTEDGTKLGEFGPIVK